MLGMTVIILNEGIPRLMDGTYHAPLMCAVHLLESH